MTKTPRTPEDDANWCYDLKYALDDWGGHEFDEEEATAIRNSVEKPIRADERQRVMEESKHWTCHKASCHLPHGGARGNTETGPGKCQPTESVGFGAPKKCPGCTCGLDEWLKVGAPR